MEPAGSYTYAEWRRTHEVTKETTKSGDDDDASSDDSSSSAAESEEDAKASGDEKEWTYQVKKDPPKPAPLPVTVQLGPPGAPQQPNYYCYPYGPQQMQYPAMQPPEAGYSYQCYPAQPAQPAYYSYQPQNPVPSASNSMGGPYTYYCYPDGQRVTVATETSSDAPKKEVEAKKDEKKESKKAEKEPKKEKAKEKTKKEEPKKVEPPKKAKVVKNVWVGRTKAEVDYDNMVVAAREGVFRFDDMQPKNAKPDTRFWVVELDGTTTLRTYCTITDKSFGGGKWETDSRHGNAYFVREAGEEQEED